MIEGKLVRLRFPEPADHRKLVEWRNDNLQYFFSDEPVSLENHLDWYERIRQDASQRFLVVGVPVKAVYENRRYADLYNDDFVPIGTIGLQNIDFRHRRAEYGRFLIAEEHRGKGYGTDTLLTLLHFAFTALGLHKVYGEVLSSNVMPALRMCLAMGFHTEGKLREHVYKQGEFVDVERISIMAPAFREKMEEIGR